MRVLALAPARGEDLGIRARRIRVIAHMEEPPQLRKLLTRISRILDRLGFRENYEIAAYTGNQPEKLSPSLGRAKGKYRGLFYKFNCGFMYLG